MLALHSPNSSDHLEHWTTALEARLPRCIVITLYIRVLWVAGQQLGHREKIQVM